MSSGPVLDAIKEMPKVELHKHLEGSVRYSTLLELTKANTGKELVKADAISDRPTDDLTGFLARFWVHQDVFNTYPNIERLAYEFVEDAHRDNTKILEMRYSPFFCAINHPELTFEGIHEAVMKGLKRGMEEFPVLVGVIGIIDRMQTLEEATEAMDFFIKNNDSFMAVDLANDELKYPATPFIPLFKRAREAGLKVTIHAGEAETDQSIQNVRQAVEELGATRIGHGIMSIKDDAVISVLKENKTVLEVCPISNYLVGIVPSIKEHPIRRLIDAGVAVTVSTDDPGMFGHDLNVEYQSIVDAGLMSVEDFKRSNEIAAQASFFAYGAEEEVLEFRVIFVRL
eukprot:TRINITY_DN524_c0_g1_i3.p1 TRINITY_DN524_c0_g1~~TRINITY_DN524_c0_g1_i3.p1  ORF type:complete len:394 (-),score=86.45 TRINITY_DN524_c0_g1_i3:86-1111(-)